MKKIHLIHTGGTLGMTPVGGRLQPGRATRDAVYVAGGASVPYQSTKGVVERVGAGADGEIGIRVLASKRFRHRVEGQVYKRL